MGEYSLALFQIAVLRNCETKKEMTKEEVVYVIIDGTCLEAHSTDCVVPGDDAGGVTMDEYSIQTHKWFESKHASNYRVVDQDGKRLQGEVTFTNNVNYIKPVYVFVVVDGEDTVDQEGYDCCSDVEIQEDYC